MKSLKKLFYGFVLISFVFILYACGGGGGGDSDATSPTVYTDFEDYYNGSTDQAVLTADNAKDYYNASKTSTDIADTSAEMVNLSSVNQDDSDNNIFSVGFITEFVEGIINNKVQSRNVQAASSTSGTEYSSCGGSADYTVSYDDYSGDVYISVNFNNYCDEGVTYNGNITIDGTVNSLGTEGNLDVKFNNFTLSDGYVSGGVIGSLKMVLNSSYAAITCNFTINRNDNDIMVKNFTVTGYKRYGTVGNYTGDYTEITVSGRIYYGSYGYVDFSTPTTIKSTPLGAYLEGELKLQGSNGTNGSVIYDGYSKTLYVDEDGDGEFDYQESL